MTSHGHRPLRYLALIVAVIAALAVVWTRLPNRSVTSELRITLGERVELAPGGDTVSLISLAIPPRTSSSGELTIRSDDGESTIPIALGQSVTLNTSAFDVAGIRPWAGLLHRPPGLPMLNVAVQPPHAKWIENIFVEHGSARILTPDIAVHVATGDQSTTSSPARWGIIEGDRTHWFSSFVPGTGLDLADGTAVTLLARQPSARILVEFDANGVKSKDWIDANQYRPGDQIRYEDADAVPFRLEINPVADASFWVSLVEGDLERWSRPTGIGLMLVDEDFGISVRIDQNEPEAVALFADESPWLEVVMSNASHVVRIREGEAVRVGETTVAFEAIADTQSAQARIAIGENQINFSEDTVYSIGDQRFDSMRALTPSEVTLGVTHLDRRLPLRAGLTALLIVAFLACLYAVRPRV